MDMCDDEEAEGLGDERDATGDERDATGDERYAKRIHTIT